MLSILPINMSQRTQNKNNNKTMNTHKNISFKSISLTPESMKVIREFRDSNNYVPILSKLADLNKMCPNKSLEVKLHSIYYPEEFQCGGFVLPEAYGYSAIITNQPGTKILNVIHDEANARACKKQSDKITKEKALIIILDRISNFGQRLQRNEYQINEIDIQQRMADMMQCILKGERTEGNKVENELEIIQKAKEFGLSLDGSYDDILKRVKEAIRNERNNDNWKTYFRNGTDASSKASTASKESETSTTEITFNFDTVKTKEQALEVFTKLGAPMSIYSGRQSIIEAHKRLAKVYHPDLCHDSKKMAYLNAAKDILLGK